jgi:lipopolysaccharide export system protein LptC
VETALLDTGSAGNNPPNTQSSLGPGHRHPYLQAEQADRAMLGRDNFHSTLVAWLKVLLPLAALGILSTLFLVSRTIDPEDAIPFAEVDVAERIREPRLTAPTWAGMTEDGSALTVSAAEARPTGETGADATASTLRAVLDMPGGGRAEMQAATGRLDLAANRLIVDGGVVVTTSTGYVLRTGALDAALDRTGLVAPGAVEGDGPGGHLTAGSMELAMTGTSPERYVMVFKDGVRLLYRPAD